MIEEILINAGPRRHRIALVQGGRLVELYLAESGGRLPERIILGRVKTVQSDLDAAFIDIGEGREGLLPARDAAVKRGTPIGRAVQEGLSLLVQVRREAEGEKGAKLSARPRLAGRALVLLPQGQDITLSGRIPDDKQRDRLLAVAKYIQKSNGGGLILRSAAAVTDDAGLEREADELWRRWQAIQAAAGSARPPMLLDAGDAPLSVILREHSGPSLRRIRVDDAALAADLRRAGGGWGDDIPALELHAESQPLFREHDLEDQIETALAQQVTLPSGGRIILEHTQALTAIDVDSARHDGAGDQARLARETNTQAAREIARQLRLREIGGRVVIDFIPMQGQGQVATLLRKLQGWLIDDPGQVRLGRMSEMGLVELTRRRRQPALALRLGEVCSLCQGSGLRPTARAVADNLLDRILREADAAKGRPLAVRAAPAVVADLGGGDGDILAGLARDRGCRVQLTEDGSLTLEEFEVTTLK
ncbi:MAG: ribonuclease E/G [Alphaproteobacteria bacterium]|nr:ribonuclease E/G [Alphaproteobacteria bacterium]